VLAAGPRHGYGITKDVERESRGDVRLEIGSLYRLLGRLLDQGLLEEADGDERSRYYRISRLGRRVLKSEADRLAGRAPGYSDRAGVCVAATSSKVPSPCE
jgi:PadR family transcriptional regulator, regulatory protein PadR